METELHADIKAPFRKQPRVAQAGSALIVAGVLLFMVVMPLHLIGFFVFPTAAIGPVALWQRFFPATFFAVILAFGVWMSETLIRMGYELARPCRLEPARSYCLNSVVRQINDEPIYDAGNWADAWRVLSRSIHCLDSGIAYLHAEKAIIAVIIASLQAEAVSKFHWNSGDGMKWFWVREPARTSHNERNASCPIGSLNILCEPLVIVHVTRQN